METGAPILKMHWSVFDCEISQIQEGGRILFLFAQLLLFKNQQDQALVYFNRHYHQVGETECV